MTTKHTSTPKTATAAATNAVEANGARKVLIIQPTGGSIRIRTDGEPATDGAGSLLLVSGEAYAPEAAQVPSSAVSMIRVGATNVDVTVVEG